MVMTYTDPEYNQFGTINCIIDHPEFGLIPTTASPDDALTADLYQAILDGANSELTDPALPIAPFVAPDPTGEQVIEERERRILAGTDLAITGYAQTVAVQFRDAEDQVNLLGQVSKAMNLILANDTTTTLVWNDRDNVQHNLTASQMLEFGTKAGEWKEAIMSASWLIKADNPIPSDYLTDSRWP